MIGTSIGPYRITAKLGAGGMGEVYRATDTKLKRDVALKVLPEAFAGDPERLARFEREAEVLASLNHPNIASIYGVVEDRALVMELVEGSEPKGPLPFDEAWAIMSQVAAALDYAHEKGVVHRDLKPANIKVTPDGQVKLLDFGLAKAFSNQPDAAANPENSPTLTIGATQVGVILGTAAYMSPEQAKGKTLDKRADIWAFGVVLYELLTGERLFAGEDVSETLAQVLMKEPDLNKVPVKARQLLKSCLEKDPKKRLRDIGDTRIALLDETTPPLTMPVRPGHGWLWPSVAALVTIALAALAFVHFQEKPPVEQMLRYTLVFPELRGNQRFALSPDGRYLAISAEVGGKRQLWLRPMDALQAHPVPFTENATYPFWSPDSRFIGFFAQGKLKKVAASGGPPQSLCDVQGVAEGSWSREGVILFANRGSIQKITAAGGVPNVVLAKGDLHYPKFVSGGRRFLYLLRSQNAGEAGIYVNSLDGKESRRILPDVSGMMFAPSVRAGLPAHVLFVRENTLMAVAVDRSNGQPTGEVFPLADDVSLDIDNTYYLPADVSENGLLLYFGKGTEEESQITWVDRSGKPLGNVGTAGQVYDPVLSPDEKQVAYRRLSSVDKSDLWVRDLIRGTETRLTSDPSFNIAPFWSPKGDRIIFSSNRSGRFRLYQKAANGSGQDELLLQNQGANGPQGVLQWSRDGRFIVYDQNDPKNMRDLWVLPAEGPPDRKPIPYLQSPFNELMGQLSPDSHWMAFTSDRSGRREVYVRPFPPADGEYTISIAGGEQPRWLGDGKELFFLGADGKMMSVAVKASVGVKSSLEAGAPKALFDAHVKRSPANNLIEYDVTADGQRFLINSDTASAPLMTVVTNWQASLNK